MIETVIAVIATITLMKLFGKNDKNELPRVQATVRDEWVRWN